MDYSQTPLWMQDDLVKDIPREKLEFLSTLFAKGHGKSQKEMMALLMPAMRKAKQEHLTFTPSTRIVTVRGENKLLPNKEFQLLEFLMINADIVFSRETIYNRIWGMESFGNTSTVPVHINRIRDAIEKDPADPQHILTIWGVGYKFRP